MYLFNHLSAIVTGPELDALFFIFLFLSIIIFFLFYNAIIILCRKYKFLVLLIQYGNAVSSRLSDRL